MDKTKIDKPRRVSITKTQRQSEVGIELISLCQSLSEDGSLSAAEIHDLHRWLEENQSSDLPAIGFLITTVRKVLEDGRISPEESRAVYKALEAILPPDLRKEAVSRRRIVDADERGKLRAAREHEKQQEGEERERNKPVGSWNFMVAGVRYENRPALIAQHVRADADAYLKRDLGNKFSRNAVEVRTEGGVPIGYVPEELASEIAPLLDKGCRHQAYFTKVLSGGRSPIPIVQAYMYGADATLEGSVTPEEVPRTTPATDQSSALPISGRDFHRNYTDQRAAIDWARNVLENKKYVILDTETTGFSNTDEIIELCIIDNMGNIIFNERIKPTKKKIISKAATDIHGIKMSDLRTCPTFRELSDNLRKSLAGKKVVTYNADYDMRIYKQTYQLAGGCIPHENWECAMIQYSKFVGEWNSRYNEYKWQKLNGDHSALGDCLATLNLLRKMASAKKLKKWYEFWIST